MQIHELNTLSGKPVDTDFLAIDTGFDTAKISAPKLLEPKISRPLDEYNQYDNGQEGQALVSNGDGTAKWKSIAQPTDAQTAQAISDWLNAHPEAVTTVTDGSLTEAKFSNALKLTTIKDYVTPQMFGAVGDGSVDDTTAFQAAIDSGKPVCIPSGSIIRVDGSVVINNTTTIFGYGPESKLRVYGSIATDSDNSHILEMFGFTFECYKITGTALIINKTNNANAKNAMSIHEMFFYFRNNVDASLNSVIMSIKGIREASIVNCVFKGDSSAYGTAILFEADSTHMTMNITIAECNFYLIGTFVKTNNNSANYIYLAGLRLINNMFIAGSYGVDAAYVDTMFIMDSMFDFVNSPIITDHCGVLKIHGNYIQTTMGQCVYIKNTASSESRFCEILNNFLWSTTQGHVVDGIVLEGVNAKNTFSTVSGNKCTALNRMIVMKNCQNCEVKDNISHDTTTFFDGNNDSTIITVRDNKADASVTNFLINAHSSVYYSDGNIWGSKFSREHGNYTFSGDGATSYKDVNHHLWKKPAWTMVSSSSPNYVVGIQKPNDTQLRLELKPTPPAGAAIEINWECAVWLY